MTVSITEFITARLGEDEQQALSASPGPWHLNAEHDEVIAIDGIEVCTAHALSNNQLRNTARHIARHDPARVLREVAAKRKIVEAASITLDIYSGGSTFIDFVIETLRRLAVAWEDHPDYDQAWRPFGEAYREEWRT